MSGTSSGLTDRVDLDLPIAVIGIPRDGPLQGILGPCRRAFFVGPGEAGPVPSMIGPALKTRGPISVPAIEACHAREEFIRIIRHVARRLRDAPPPCRERRRHHRSG